MLTLYHGTTSTCSQKARLGLAEKGVAWTGVVLDLNAGDQYRPEYLKLNPNGVVPTLVHDGMPVIESTVILQYVDDAFPGPRLTPKDAQLAARMRVWLLRTLDIHAATAVLTFATAFRAGLMKRSAADREAYFQRIPNPTKQAKRRELVEKGIASDQVDDAILTFARLFEDMAQATASAPWLLGEAYSLADIALLPYVDRLDRLGLDTFWAGHPSVAGWLKRSRSRESYASAVEAFVDPSSVAPMRALGAEAAPLVKRKLAG